jgi:adenosylcobinamide amidohydrolase
MNSESGLASQRIDRLPAQLAGIRISLTDKHVRLELPEPWRVCGWAPLGGGLTMTRQMFILKVAGDAGCPSLGYSPPETTLERYHAYHGWPGPVMGMMTAASMDSCRISWRLENGVAVLVVLTAGLTNARRAGDRADCRWDDEYSPPAGTINILAATNANLADASLVEALMIMTEAKSAVLQEHGVTSPVSGLTATGTGTDCAAVACGYGLPIRWCGKHVAFGEMLAKAVMEALASSLAWDG